MKRSESEVDEIIEKWHNGELPHEYLHEALGWTQQEYYRFVEQNTIPEE